VHEVCINRISCRQKLENARSNVSSVKFICRSVWAFICLLFSSSFFFRGQT
jgi:hypothetical protein